MDNQEYNSIVSFIWGIADDCLRDVYVRGKYRDVILPMTVIRRLDAMLEETKPAVLTMKKQLDSAKIDNQWPALCNAAGQAFCNASPFLLKDLTSRSKAQTLKADFTAYLDGFSPNVQLILDKFKFRNQIDTMVDADILGAVIEKFTSSDINLSPNPIYKDAEKTILKHSGLDNHGMGTIFEELIRKFNEENNEEAGEHWTPRDVVELMADLVFMPIADKIKDASYSCYDGACGTGGMLTVAQDRLLTLAHRRNKDVAIHLFGQEVQPETFAICTADMLLKGDGEEAGHIMYGSTLSDDQHASRQFDFMLSNPPYGKSWKTDAEKMGGKKDILDTRFNTYLEGGEAMQMIPRTSDGQLLFLLNNVSKMKKDTELGSRIVEVHNGSSIFTGDAGSGESNARRYLFENDLVEAIIALPDKMFYNTPLNTYIWVLTNKKEERRKGKVQLIDAIELKKPLRKKLGDKSNELTSEFRKRIMEVFLAFEESDISHIYDNEEFGFWEITVLQPKYTEDGILDKDKKGKVIPDKDKTYTEVVPFAYEGGIDGYFANEIKPFTKDAWIDDKKTKIGYEVSFTKCFYKPIHLRTFDEVVSELHSLEKLTDGMFDEIVGGIS
jgi:type I restriction enzyme M protein